ncbi:shikimate kinase [Thermanaeromonas sp. C210]|uniref:shikimate kinase n=1 Tax=Thermanaeromonas sp. C210 TaxID=2731925 RepID=UPI00155C8608|nr:shikimate kinase [Thermanaeromonas sp. C210]GFN23287.1 shikimate kinase [Thermanaeromonas sp. C210]
MPGNIVLIGFMASGKTTVGRLLAGKLGWNFFDTDTEVEKKASCSIAELFAREGEAYFRELEKEVIARLMEGTRAVVSTGGGAVLAPENVERLRRGNKVIWLKVDEATVWRRVAGSAGRPLVRGRSREEVAALLKKREPYYSFADLKIDTAAKGPEEIVEEIMEGLKGWPAGCRWS